MNRHLTEHLAALAAGDLGKAIAPAEGFEVIVAGRSAAWRQSAPPRQQDGEVLWELEQVGGGLRATVRLRADLPHRAARYRVDLANAAESPVVLDAVHPLVVRFPGIAGAWRTLRAKGGTSENFYPPRAYGLTERVVFGGEVRIESPPGGRSSDRHLPILLATAGTDENAPGAFAALEYSGEWFLCLRHVGSGPFLRARLKATGMSLAPGEVLALPAAHVGFFAGGLGGGTNALRRYVRDCVCPPRPGSAPAKPPRPATPPVSYDHWFGIGNNFDQPLMRRQVKSAARLGAEYWVHDAGWFEGGFPAGVGNWHRPDPVKYPAGLKPLAEAVRAAGMKFGLWFEIERAMEHTWAAREFSQLFFPPRPTPAGTAYHLNLARKDAQDWAVETIARWIDELGLEWVRLDYNIDPAEFFRQADPTGKVQIAYCQGLYRVLDALVAGHPRCLLEACSGGGRRIDLGTLRRADTCWISDQSFSADICRHMQCRLGSFLPGHLANSAVCVRRGAAAGRFGDVDALSRMCGALSFNGDVASWPAALVRRMRKWTDAYKRLRHLLDEDFHPLLPPPTTDRQWDAVQFADGGAESIVLAYRMGGETERSVLRPRGIDPDGAYRLSRLPGAGRGRTVAGADLARRGLAIRLRPHSGCCIHLRKCAAAAPG